ncbi:MULTISPECIES: ATP-binding protein [unclassified Streptomyces]|uniref:ATP-binding protein n=1 Tax=unclassified Streptomyces TaxID=2593676 RepID=UPI0033DCF126
MTECRFKVPRKPWHLPFLAEPEELRGLRNVMRLHLGVWGLPHMIDAAQLCVTELVTNVITHVGRGTPTTLAVSMRGGSLRLEVTDPDARALPTLLAATEGDESGRGMALVAAVATRWGVVLRAESKVTWCELATGLPSADGHIAEPGVDTAEALLSLYCYLDHHAAGGDATSFSVALAEETAIQIIADLLDWLRAHGCDLSDTLDQALTRCEVAAS